VVQVDTVGQAVTYGIYNNVHNSIFTTFLKFRERGIRMDTVYVVQTFLLKRLNFFYSKDKDISFFILPSTENIGRQKDRTFVAK
jgi:hypothetical protein